VSDGALGGYEAEPIVRARFDDHGPNGSSFVLTDPVCSFVAHQPEEVADVLHLAEEAARGGRWVAGFISYEAAPGLDPSLPVCGWTAGGLQPAVPLAWFAAFRRREETTPVASPGRPGVEGGTVDWELDRGSSWHRDAVVRIQDGIAAGDYYQVNLTSHLRAVVPDPDRLYARLAAAQGGRYHALMVTPEHTVVSASPELFFSLDGGEVVTRPMKGTAPRGRWPEEDRSAVEALRASPKEQAENVMIVDLLRNDLGRVAVFGSVRVSSLFDVERYPTVWQLTSTVTARVPPGVGVPELFGALFPSGSVTGAPKRAAMQAIVALETRPRGVYCGAVGYIRPDPVRPSARFAVAIRTVTVANHSHAAEYGAGGGITASSRPDAEWSELLAKSLVLRDADRPRSLIETFRFEPPATVVNLERHLDRLRSSAEYFGFRFDRRAVDAALDTALGSGMPRARVRVTLHPAGDVWVDTEDLVTVAGPVTVGLADHPVSSSDVLLYHKHGDRSRYEAFRRSQPDLGDVVLWNERGQVTEVTTANLAVRVQGCWYTPALGCGLLPGVERGRLLEEGTLVEREITVSECVDAEGLAVISSLRGWRQAVLVGLPSGVRSLDPDQLRPAAAGLGPERSGGAQPTWTETRRGRSLEDAPAENV